MRKRLREKMIADEVLGAQHCWGFGGNNRSTDCLDKVLQGKEHIECVEAQAGVGGEGPRAATGW